VTRPQKGHFEKTGAGAPPVKVIKGSRAGNCDADGVVAARRATGCWWTFFSEARFCGREVGTSKGRGFAGVVRRHKFAGGPKSHGHMFQVQGLDWRQQLPPRASFPASAVPGHMGAEQVDGTATCRIRGIDLEENLLMVEGAVPGSREGYVLISKAKIPPRERRGFAGSGTVDPLKASKKAGGRGSEHLRCGRRALQRMRLMAGE